MSICVSLETKVKEGKYEMLLPFLQKNLPQGALSVSLLYD